MSAIHWFEIPVKDIQRAVSFYQDVLGEGIQVMDMTETMGSMIGMLPNRGGQGGALVQNEQQGYVPAKTGTLVYLIVSGGLGDALGKVEAGGGSIVLPKTPMGEGSGGGFIAWIVDTEGNRVGLYSKAE